MNASRCRRSAITKPSSPTPSSIAWLEKLLAAELVCVDTETTGLDMMNAQLVGISFAIEPHHAAYLPLAHRYPGAPDQLDREHALAKLKPWLESAQHKKLGQNLKYDLHIFANHGIALAGIHDDTLLQSYVLESHRPHDMGNLALRHLGRARPSATPMWSARARSRSASTRSISTPPRAMPPKMPTSRCSCTSASRTAD